MMNLVEEMIVEDEDACKICLAQDRAELMTLVDSGAGTTMVGAASSSRNNNKATTADNKTVSRKDMALALQTGVQNAAGSIPNMSSVRGSGSTVGDECELTLAARGTYNRTHHMTQSDHILGGPRPRRGRAWLRYRMNDHSLASLPTFIASMCLW